MRRDFLITYLGEAVLCATGLLVYKVAAQRFGADGFAAYALGRRTVSLLLPAALLGLGVGIPRYTAMQARPGAADRGGNFLLGGAALLLGVAMASFVAMGAFPAFFARILLGSGDHASLIPPVGLMLAGIAAYTAVYSHLRGAMAFTWASVVKVLLLGVAPLAACLLAAEAEAAMMGTGAAWLATSLVLLVLLVRRRPPELRTLVEDSRTLVFYGVRRVPGELCMSGLLAAPALVTAHLAGLRAGGEVAFATSVLTLLATAFGPLGLILLPKMSELVSRGEGARIRRSTTRLLIVTLTVSVLAVGTFQAFAADILALYLSTADPALVRVCQIVFLAGLFHPVYVSLRSVLDALSARAINSRNTFVSLLFFSVAAATTYFLGFSHEPILYAFVASMGLLALLTVYTCRRTLPSLARQTGSALS